MFYFIDFGKLVVVQPLDNPVDGVLDFLLARTVEFGGDIVIFGGVLHVVGVVFQCVLRLNLLLMLLIFRFVLLRIFLIEPTLIIGNSDLVLLASGLIISKYIQDTIGINVEANGDLRNIS